MAHKLKSRETKDLDRALSRVLEAIGDPQDRAPGRPANPSEVFVKYAEELEKELRKQASLVNFSTEDENFLRAVGITTLAPKEPSMDDRKIDFETLIGEMLTCHNVNTGHPVCPKCGKPSSIWVESICGGCYIALSHDGEPVH